jgi:hypothetical protein
MPPKLSTNTTLQSWERRFSPRFGLTLEISYTVADRGVPLNTGSGRTIDLSSSGLNFAADRPLLTGQNLGVSIDWPALLNGDIRLQLIVSGVVVRSNGTATAVQILRHEFRTRRVGPRFVPPQKLGD